MSELIKETKITHHVWYPHLEMYLSEKVGKRIEIIDSPNDTDYHVLVRAKTEFDKWDQKYINELLEDGYISMECGYRTILDYCAGQGWLEEGDYIITVSW